MTAIDRTDLAHTNGPSADRVWRRWSALSETADRGCEITGAVAGAALVSFVVAAVASAVVNTLATRGMIRVLGLDPNRADRGDRDGAS